MCKRLASDDDENIVALGMLMEWLSARAGLSHDGSIAVYYSNDEGSFRYTIMVTTSREEAATFGNGMSLPRAWESLHTYGNTWAEVNEPEA